MAKAETDRNRCSVAAESLAITVNSTLASTIINSAHGYKMMLTVHLDIGKCQPRVLGLTKNLTQAQNKMTAMRINWTKSRINFLADTCPSLSCLQPAAENRSHGAEAMLLAVDDSNIDAEPQVRARPKFTVEICLRRYNDVKFGHRFLVTIFLRLRYTVKTMLVEKPSTPLPPDRRSIARPSQHRRSECRVSARKFRTGVGRC